MFNTTLLNMTNFIPNKFIKVLGDKFTDPTTSHKSYWKIVNQLLNKSKVPNLFQTCELRAQNFGF